MKGCRGEHNSPTVGTRVTRAQKSERQQHGWGTHRRYAVAALALPQLPCNWLARAAVVGSHTAYHRIGTLLAARAHGALQPAKQEAHL